MEILPDKTESVGGNMSNVNEISLTELISAEMLQDMQDSIAGMLDVTSMITDENGNAITGWSAESSYCDMIMNDTVLGGKLCAQCIRAGLAKAHKKGSATINYCHAGVMECIAPIVLNGRILGGIVAVQILAEKLDESFLRSNAEELMINGDALCAVADKVKVRTRQDIERIGNFVYTMASIVTRIIEGKINTLKVSEEVMNAGTAKSEGDHSGCAWRGKGRSALHV